MLIVAHPLQSLVPAIVVQFGSPRTRLRQFYLSHEAFRNPGF